MFPIESPWQEDFELVQPVPKASPSSSTSHTSVIAVGGWFKGRKKGAEMVEMQIIISYPMDMTIYHFSFSSVINLLSLS